MGRLKEHYYWLLEKINFFADDEGKIDETIKKSIKVERQDPGQRRSEKCDFCKFQAEKEDDS